jgi:D-amino-acid oxidase
MSKLHFCIVGAGVVGLSTALELKRYYPKSKITICYEANKNETNSFGAGGFWEPYSIKGTPASKVKEWGQYSYEHFKECERLGVPGVSSCKAWGLYHPQVENEFIIQPPFWSTIVENFHEITQEERIYLTKKLGSGIELAESGCFSFGSIIADQSVYLPWLMKKLKNLGNVIFIPLNEKLNRLMDVLLIVTDHINLLCNCTGFGSYFLKDVKDHLLVPVRGQVVRVQKKDTKITYDAFTYETPKYCMYILPNHDTIVLGGTAEEGEFELVVDEQVLKRIVNSTKTFLPEISELNVVSSWTGRRPTRIPLRMEIVDEDIKNKFPPILHLYGHGGCGVTIGLGSAHDAVKNLVLPFLNRCGGAASSKL